MSRIWTSLALAMIAALLAGCATPVTQRIGVDSSARAQEEQAQRRLAIKTAFDYDVRLRRVGYTVLKGAVDQCGAAVRPAFGFQATVKDRLPPAQRDEIATAIGWGEQKKVYAISRWSAAESAGLKEGDILVGGFDLLFPPTDGETREAAALRLPAGQPVSIQVLRDGAPTTVKMVPDRICDYPLRVTQGQEVNAYADGKAIMVSRGMMRFASDDRELALVIGHELGHNTMGHLDKQKTNAAVGMIFDVLAAAARVNTQGAFMKAGQQAFSQDFEAEADYVGLYYLARAGYDTSGAAEFWRRMAAEHPGSIKSNHAATHPATAERFLALEKTSTEIGDKKAGGMPLNPNRTK